MIPPALLATPAVPLAPAPSHLDAYQPGPRGGDGLAASLNAALDGFGARAAQMQASVRDIAAADTGTALKGARPPGVGESAPLTPASSASAAEAGPAKPGPVALMVDCFNFAIEATLVSRAASQFTGSVSTLMKGQ